MHIITLETVFMSFFRPGFNVLPGEVCTGPELRMIDIPATREVCRNVPEPCRNDLKDFAAIF